MSTPSYTRQVILDTETTGMNQAGGPIYLNHKIIEIGCVEVINRRLTGNHFHVYIKPDRLVDPEAFEVHGISDDFLKEPAQYQLSLQDLFEAIDSEWQFLSGVNSSNLRLNNIGIIILDGQMSSRAKKNISRNSIAYSSRPSAVN